VVATGPLNMKNKPVEEMGMKKAKKELGVKKCKVAKKKSIGKKVKAKNTVYQTDKADNFFVVPWTST